MMRLLLALGLLLAMDAAAAGAPTAAELLAQAEELSTGAGGRLDLPAADRLYAAAAGTGDPLATFRFATLPSLRQGTGLPTPEQAQALFARSRQQVEAMAAAGDPHASCILGTALLVGADGRRDVERARQLLERAAEGDAPWGWHNLGWMQQQGLAHPRPDPRAALASYEQSAIAGNAVSMYNLAQLLVVPGNADDCQRGARWLERAATANHRGAIALLGKVLLYGRERCLEAAPGRALPWLRDAARDDAGARADLGLALLTGAGGDRDPMQGLALLEATAADGEPFSAEVLIWSHGAGIGTARDPARSRYWLETAAGRGRDGFDLLVAERSDVARRLLADGEARLSSLAQTGDAAAAGLLARRFYTNHAASGDIAAALRWASLGAEGGDPSAMRVLGHALRNGNGAPADTAAALRWWKQGAEAGESFCMMFYGNALLAGELVERDVEAGIRWLERAAALGNYWAIGDLSRLWDEGLYGIQRDESKALPWRRRRAALGDDEARGWLIYHGYNAD